MVEVDLLFDPNGLGPCSCSSQPLKQEVRATLAHGRHRASHHSRKTSRKSRESAKRSSRSKRDAQDGLPSRGQKRSRRSTRLARVPVLQTSRVHVVGIFLVLPL